MTARRRLVPEREVRSMVEMLRDMGIAIGAIEVRADGVTIHPATESGGDEYDRWAKASRRD